MTTQSNTPTLNQFFSKASLLDFQLPGDTNNDLYIIGVSGGADSTCLTILLCALFPSIDFILLFTDTQAEADGTLQAIERLEAYVNKPVTRITAQDSLYELIDEWNGYLPSGQSRYCTRILKTEVYEDFIEDLRGESGKTVHSFVGIRADEPSRTGFDSSMPWLISHFPMQSLGMTREDVFKVLEETTGIPNFYMHRSRSGCHICPFMRTSEILQTITLHPKNAFEAQRYEKLSTNDTKRFVIAGEDWSGLRMAYPLPYSLDIRNSVKKKADNLIQKKTVNSQTLIDDLFGQTTIVYVGVEYLQCDMMSMFDSTLVGTSGLWHSELIGWSTSKSGIVRKLNTQYTTRIDTAEVWGLSVEEFKNDYKQAIYTLEIPSDVIDLGKTESTVRDLPGLLVNEQNMPITFTPGKLYMNTIKDQLDIKCGDQSTPIDSEIVFLLSNGQRVEIVDLMTIPYNTTLQQLCNKQSQPVMFNGQPVFRRKKSEVLKQGTFSWHQGEPIAKIKMAASVIKKTLTRERLIQDIEQLKPFRDTLSWEAEQYHSTVKELQSFNKEHGHILNQVAYQPKEQRHNTDPTNTPCIVCSK